MAAESFSHMIGVTDWGFESYQRLGSLFGSRPRAIELALDWSIANDVPVNGRFAIDKQIHTHLSRNYRERYSPPALASFLHAGLVHFWSRPKREPAWRGLQYWQQPLDEATARAIEDRAFRLGEDRRLVLHDLWRTAVRSLALEAVTPVRSFEIATDPETREEYSRLAASLRHLDLETVIARRMAKLARIQP